MFFYEKLNDFYVPKVRTEFFRRFPFYSFTPAWNLLPPSHKQYDLQHPPLQVSIIARTDSPVGGYVLNSPWLLMPFRLKFHKYVVKCANFYMYA